MGTYGDSSGHSLHLTATEVAAWLLFNNLANITFTVITVYFHYCFICDELLD